ncbi:polysaccharide pyruvyl transferase family protein [Roseovarius sp.]|uniref:polysaccharide pyruvyl transferase family protein n=1 Tax=Roseovarius sp. TaxID=1486281 RepID=UPI003A9869DE
MNSSGGEKPRDIIITGMFDMPNFGDLMFPVVAAHELGRRGFHLHPLSPTGAETGLRDALPSRAIWTAFDPSTPCDGVLIGGGYIVHTHRMDPLKEYREGGIGAAVGPATWLGATLAAALRDVPVAWNAPGVPHPIRPGVRPLAAAAFAAADYLSLRDAGSIRMACLFEHPQVEEIPDTILGLERVWSRSGLAADFSRVCTTLGVTQRDRVLAVHVRRRSLGAATVGELADGLASVCLTLELTPVLIGLGTAHADDRIARELATALGARGVVAAALDRPRGLRDIAALIAYARAYAGSSLHGYITAAAYGVPGLLVARPAYRKFDGLINHLGRKDDLMKGWPEALLALRAAVVTPPRPLPLDISVRLERHWDMIAKTFMAGSKPKRHARLEFAALAFSAGLRQDGPNWAMTPFTTAQDRSAALAGDDVRETEPF